ncbi:MAG: flagellar hook assembly protein FlgD [Cellvibrionaceae bacterium]|nr:flagellar hook assembly protein FlgD [Cellvibrionaceae bacterium]
MTDISSNAYLNSLTLNAQQQQTVSETDETADNTLGQSAFLELMITQMENQSPLDPQDNSEFVAQLAQFSSVEGLDRLNNNFDDFAYSFMSNQALQASSLVGQSVSVPGTSAQLIEGDVVSGSFHLPATSADVNMAVYNTQGVLVDEIPLGAREAGDSVFRWDGSRIEIDGELLDWESANSVAPGEYEFAVIAHQEGEPQQLDMALSANVNSVTVDTDNHIILNLAGVGSVNIDDVKQFN